MFCSRWNKVWRHWLHPLIYVYCLFSSLPSPLCVPYRPPAPSRLVLMVPLHVLVLASSWFCTPLFLVNVKLKLDLWQILVALAADFYWWVRVEMYKSMPMMSVYVWAHHRTTAGQTLVTSTQLYRQIHMCMMSCQPFYFIDYIFDNKRLMNNMRVKLGECYFPHWLGPWKEKAANVKTNQSSSWKPFLLWCDQVHVCTFPFTISDYRKWLYEFSLTLIYIMLCIGGSGWVDHIMNTLMDLNQM